MDAFEAGKFFGGALGWSVDTTVNTVKAAGTGTQRLVQGIVAGYNEVNRNEGTTIAQVAAPVAELVLTAEQEAQLNEMLVKFQTINTIS